MAGVAKERTGGSGRWRARAVRVGGLRTGGALVSTGAMTPSDACRVGLSLVNHQGNDTKANDNVELALAA
jgi:hypothetical protein